MRSPVDLLARAPDDPATWAVCVDWLLDRPLGIRDPELIALLDALFADAAWLCPSHDVLRRVEAVPPSLTLEIRDGQPRLLRASDDGWWEEGVLSPEALVPALMQAWERSSGASPQREALLAAARRALAHLAPRDNVELDGLEVYRWSRVVEVVADPERESSLERVRGIDALTDWQVGDEIGDICPVETQLVAMQLLLALRQARPVRIVPPPDPRAVVALALAREAERVVRSPGEVARGIEALVRIRRDHDVYEDLVLRISDEGDPRLALPVEAVAEEPGPGQCLAAEVGAAPGAVVGFDRGPIPIEDACRLVEKAIVEWCHLHDDGSDAPLALPLADLLPVRPVVLRALVRRLRTESPVEPVQRSLGAARRLDDHALFLRYAALPEPRKLEVIFALAEAMAEAIELRHAARWRALVAGLRQIAQEGGDPGPLCQPSGLIGELVAEGRDESMVLMILGDLVARRAGARGISGLYTQDGPSARSVTSRLRTWEDADLERLVGAL